MKKIFRYLWKKRPPALEEGLTAVNYAVYFVVIITALLIYTYCQFNAGMLVVEQELEDGLQLAEGAMISANQAEIDDSIDDFYKRTDDFETELNRLMVVTEIGTAKESEQIKRLADVYLSYLKEQLWLAEDGITPTEATLKSVCGEDSNIRFNELYIYQPIYKVSVVHEEGEHSIFNGRGDIKADGPLDEKTSLKGFKQEYEITDWVKYTLFFTDTNEYERYVKETLNQEAPKLHNGHKAEGATIEASLSVKVYGLKNIFAGVSTKTPELTGEVTTKLEDPVSGMDTSITYEQNMTGLTEADTPLFAEKPTQDAYDITVWQAVDVVPSETDSHRTNR